METNQFETQRTALMNEKRKPDVNLGIATERHWNQILGHEYEFKRNLQEV